MLGPKYSITPMTTQQVNLLSRYQVGSSQENLTKSFFYIRVVFIQDMLGPCY